MALPRRRLHDLETLRLKGGSMLGWETLAWTALAGLGLYLFGLGNHVLWDYHEPYVGGIVREMAQSGDWVVPTLNGQPYLEKPPLFYALSALICRTFGSFEPWALRLPSALLASLTAVWISYLGWRLSSARAGGWAGFMVATSALYFLEGHSAVVDMTLTAAVSFALGFAYLALVEPPYRARWTKGFWASLGFAFLAKGIVGPVMVLLPVAAVLALRRDRDLLRDFLRPNWGMAVAVLLALGWVLPLALRGGREYLVEVFLRNTLGRFLASPTMVPRTGALGEHVEPFWFYFERTPGNLLPWLPVWVAALWSARPRRGHPLVLRTAFIPVAFLAILVLLQASAAKRMVYLLPILPLTFLQAALWLDLRMPKRRARAPRPVLWVLGTTLFLVGFLGAGLPWVLRARAHVDLGLTTALCLLSLLLSGIALALFWQRRLPLVVDWTMAQWTFFLALILVFAVPDLDREWRPILEPYTLARTLEAQGASVHEGRLSETQLGYASLAFRRVIPPAGTSAEVRRLMESPRPAVLLAEPKFYWRQELRPAGLGEEWPTGASRSWRLWDRAPALILNPAARALLGPPGPPGSGSLPNPPAAHPAASGTAAR